MQIIAQIKFIAYIFQINSNESSIWFLKNGIFQQIQFFNSTRPTFLPYLQPKSMPKSTTKNNYTEQKSIINTHSKPLNIIILNIY